MKSFCEKKISVGKGRREELEKMIQIKRKKIVFLLGVSGLRLSGIILNKK